jgi:hypothetical protein
MTVEQIRAVLNPALMLATMAASFTKTQKDDQAVALLKKIVTNNEIMDGIVKLFEKEGEVLPNPF